ncbi:MAG: NADH-quinone oxidoreductase subunit H [Oryzomonas sp.]|uniref:respiratory chain complex I subunit 1 family protein n=1 Tax=Oryzomonas sp. TaxID=2855186 RepID=UPI002842BDAA|nr:NADH-quinone oxidoreductase subunit H [Oryzomonas sp.]MDR3580267.1 NADH-quinone oxidoreductase subunit H [Oryzomonas sp.]
MTDIIIHCAVALLFPPLLLGVIGKTKAAFAGRVGAPYFQPYYDLIKLFRKGSVFSETTTWVFRAGPVVTLSATLIAVLLIPLGRHAAPLSFSGDLILFAYLFGLSRFFTTLAALDTGSSFEGMGAAREATFSCLAEPTLFFALITLARMSKSLTLSTILTHPTLATWLAAGSSMLLLSGALFIILLAENCRIPFDDPNTHLELTMIHEVMVLDHSGPALGIILYGAALKLFVLGAIFVNVALPVATGDPLTDWAIFIVAMLALAMAIGIVESVMARLRLVRIPQLLIGATILSAFAMLLVLR